MSNRYREAFIDTLCKGRPRRLSVSLVRFKETGTAGAMVTGSRALHAMPELDDVNASTTSATRHPTVERVDASTKHRCDCADADMSQCRSGQASPLADGHVTSKRADLVATCKPSSTGDESPAAPSAGHRQSRFVQMRNRLAVWRAERAPLTGRPIRCRPQAVGKVRGWPSAATEREPENAPHRVRASSEVSETDVGLRDWRQSIEHCGFA